MIVLMFYFKIFINYLCDLKSYMHYMTYEIFEFTENGSSRPTRHQEADVAPEVMTGAIQVFDRDAYVLIDPGATHSFISVKFIAPVNIEIQPIDCSMVVSLPTGDSIIADRVYMGCRVIIEGHEFRANLVLLDIQDFDVILGMDWLPRHYATMDCFRKEVKFCRPGDTLRDRL